jgi:hypothetical protein
VTFKSGKEGRTDRMKTLQEKKKKKTLQELVGISNPHNLKGTLRAQPIRMLLSAHLISIKLEQCSEKMAKMLRPHNFSGTLSWDPSQFWELYSLLFFCVNKLSYFTHCRFP